MSKETIVHVIDSLGRGGTETLLTDLLPALAAHYNIVLVTLHPKNEFGTECLEYCSEYYCLHHKGPSSFLSSVQQLKKIIRDHRPVLVRSQLVMSTIIARLATPQRVPLVFSIHNTLSVLIKRNFSGQLVRLLEKKVRKKNTVLIGVTRAIITDYIQLFSYRGEHHVLYNYVRDEFFKLPASPPQKTAAPLRLIAVGNLRKQKNYPYLIEAFKKLKDVNAELDIYGDGELADVLAGQVDEYKVRINLKGKIPNIHEVLPQYDAFVMVSSFEGFGIAVAEAMAAGMPLILSDIGVFREITQGNALFVDPGSVDSFVSVVRHLAADSSSLESMSSVNRQIAKDNYSKEGYLKKLLSIYTGVLARTEKAAGKQL